MDHLDELNNNKHPDDNDERMLQLIQRIREHNENSKKHVLYLQNLLKEYNNVNPRNS